MLLRYLINNNNIILFTHSTAADLQSPVCSWLYFFRICKNCIVSRDGFTPQHFKREFYFKLEIKLYTKIHF